MTETLMWRALKEVPAYCKKIANIEISENDILRLSLSNKITISVIFLEAQPALIGDLVNEKPKGRMVTGLKGEPIFLANDNIFQISPNQHIKFHEKTIEIIGFWNLTMYGAERNQIEALLFENLGKSYERINLDGVLLEANGKYCQLQTYFESETPYLAIIIPDNESLFVLTESNIKTLMSIMTLSNKENTPANNQPSLKHTASAAPPSTNHEEQKLQFPKTIEAQKGERDDIITSAIKQAVIDKQSYDTNIIFAHISHQVLNDKFLPFDDVKGTNLLYTDGSESKKLTKKVLGERLRRLKKKYNSN